MLRRKPIINEDNPATALVSENYGKSSHAYQDHPIPRLRREKRLRHLTGSSLAAAGV